MKVAIIGAGIAGASLAWSLRGRAEVTLFEAEARPGYHTTGRSAAFFAETYGGPDVQPLSTASLQFFHSPPEGFAGPLLRPRGGLYIAEDKAQLAALDAEFAGTAVELGRATAPDYVRGAWRGEARFEPGCRDIEVAALHQGFLRGTRLVCGVEARPERVGDKWRVGGEDFEVVAVAAGAWADRAAAAMGARPIGLQAMQRTVSVVRVEPEATPDLPLVIEAEGRFYFKPEGNRLWLSPHDETPAEPGDVQAEELAVASAIDRFERATHFKVVRVERSWAGLRTFAPDRLPVYGYDPVVPGLFWCAGQGGFGIQTAPAAGRLAAAMLLGEGHGVPGIDAARYAASRFA